jgi:hypothetical protein
MTMSSLIFPLLILALSPSAERMAANDKLAHAQRIFDELVEARGDRSLPKPMLLWTVEPSRGAYFTPGTNQITLEERAYDVCTSFGDRTDHALAFILSHELVHYYKQHGWEASFGNKFRDTEVGREVNEDLRDIKQQETESDLLGGFLSYTAGFNTVGIAAEFLPRLYDKYPKWCRKDCDQYPSLEERVLIAKTTEKELRLFIQMFETANLLVAVEHYDDALEYYQYILSKYKSRELVNNVGVVACMRAMKEFDKDQIQYLYPLELDAEARLRLGSKGIDAEDPKKIFRDSLLRAAIGHFQEAMELDKDYHTARLNLASAYALLALSEAGVNPDEEELNYDFAYVYAKQTLRRADKESDAKLRADAQVLMGIIAAYTGEGDAGALFREAEEKSTLALPNLRILEKTPPAGINRKPRGTLPEQIEEVSLARFRGESDTLLIFPGTRFNRQWGYNVKTSKLEASRILIDFVNAGQYAFFHLTEPGYADETRQGIRLGSTREDILAKYLDPDREIQLPNGHMLVYGADQIIFMLDTDRKLKQWVVYQVKPDL